MASSQILVVEDDPYIAHILEFMLARGGYAVEIVRDGAAAAERISRGAPPALVLLDVMLPYKDGYELLAQLRGQTGWEQTPVLMLTARSQEKDIVRALDAGASDYVVKPFQPREVSARIKRLLAAAA